MEEYNSMTGMMMKWPSSKDSGLSGAAENTTTSHEGQPNAMRRNLGSLNNCPSVKIYRISIVVIEQYISVLSERHFDSVC